MTKKQILQYLKKNELDIQNATSSLFFLDFVYGAYVDSENIHGVRFSPIFTFMVSGKKSGYFQVMSKDLISKVASKMYFWYKKNPAKVKALMAAHGRIAGEMISLWKKFEAEDKKTLTRQEWIKYYQLIIGSSREWWKYSSIGEDKGEVINREVAPAFAKRNKIEINEARRIIIALSHPKGQSVLNSGRILVLNTCLYIIENGLKKVDSKKLLKNKKIAALARKYLAENFWAKCDFYRAKKINVDDFFGEIKNEIANKGEKKLREELAEIKNNFRKIKKEKRKILAKLKLLAADKKDLDFSLLATTWIDMRKKWMMEVCFCTFAFFEDFCNYLGIGYDEFSAYFINEAEDLIKSGKKLPDKEIAARRSGGVFFSMEHGKIGPSIFHGQDGQDLFLASQHKIIEGEEIKGFVASNGGLTKISGRVSRIFDAEKDSFNAGDILIASMTRVEYVPLMRKAKAVITDEGGIACHAAIVSRELGMPAIIGTKNAMQKLKTGDMVEMDLKSGVIKIIK